jgi:hypothetical protein
MNGWRWVVHDAAGSDVSSTEAFPSKDDAEAWLGAHWSELLDDGGESVTLMEGDRAEYRMGLREE